MNKRLFGIVVGVLLVIAALSYAFWDRTDPQVRKVLEMQKNMHRGDGPPDPEKGRAFREEMRKLTDEQREEVMRPMHEERERRMDKQLAEYFALTPDKRKEYLDKQITEMEKHRKEWEARRAQSGQGQNRGGPNADGPGAGPGGPGPGGPGMGAGGPGGPNPPGGPNAGGRGGPQNRTPESRSARRNQRLDNLTPTQRAQRAAYFQDLAKRRAQLGLPAMGFPGGPRPR